MAEMQFNQILATIDTGALVMKRDAWGNVDHWVSRDVGFVCERIQAEEALCNAVKKSGGMAFVIERDANGAKVIRTFPAAQCFYQLISCHWNSRIEKYRLGIRSEKIEEILRGFNVQGTIFTKNPLAMITEGVVEGDIVNAIARRIFEVVTGKSLIAKIKAERSDLRNAYTKAERLMHRLLENHGRLAGLPMNLCYRAEYSNKDVFVHAEKHLGRFLALFDEMQKSSGLAGFWWKHEHVPGLGYRHYLLAWFREAGDHRDALADAIRSAWEKATDGYGYVEYNEFDQQIPRSWGMQSLIMKGSVPLQDTLKSIQLMLLRDQYCRLSLWGTAQPFGYSPLPPPIQKLKTPSCFDEIFQQRFSF